MLLKQKKKNLKKKPCVIFSENSEFKVMEESVTLLLNYNGFSKVTDHMCKCISMFGKIKKIHLIAFLFAVI